jgi:hypothetical protein
MFMALMQIFALLSTGLHMPRAKFQDRPGSLSLCVGLLAAMFEFCGRSSKGVCSHLWPRCYMFDLLWFLLADHLQVGASDLAVALRDGPSGCTTWLCWWCQGSL